ncbi:FAD/NAD(P)-binding domain-containing protein [Periconia macrospinosa]|uniref:Cholesterol oxidase n=1 Tax=Periconia macrospinosa TaxID=97972 RepID=A0A2V1D0W9_9PLEO|nr:FAD/NAD(P)-binding domain-containing protein [Periconia macrospinosa]
MSHESLLLGNNQDHIETQPDREKTWKASKFPRLSRPVPMMRSEYDVVVVGSGYGAGVAASRMARAGKSVAVLELGKEKWPGEYPIDLKGAIPEFHISGHVGKAEESFKNIAHGKKTGLYHLVFGEGQNAFIANGLGGTSLLNANVFLPADERTLKLHTWPPEILEADYDRAAKMLQPVSYPESYPPLKKLEVLGKQAKALGQSQNFHRVPQTTFFRGGVNNAGVHMKASTGSGQDCTGVNDGSKNSVLVTYLADAWNWGAEMFCECEVRYVQREKKGDGYIVFFAWHGSGRDAFGAEGAERLMWVRAKQLCVLGAGALGTTEILLRSKKHGLATSSFPGQKVSGNGDILSFAYNTDHVINGVGRENPDPSNPPGPTITGVIDARNPETSPNALDGYVIQEGAIPGALSPFIQAYLEIMPEKVFPNPLKFDMWRHFWSRTKSRFLGPYASGGSVERTQTYLIMSHDSNEGILALSGDKATLQFLGVGNTERVTILRELMTKASNEIGGTLVDEPFYPGPMRTQLTVHPLGGATMSSDGTGRYGAVDHMGRVFTGDDSRVHHGLLCVDAAVIPTALGVNPFATITALAERSCDLFLQEKSWTVDETENGVLDLFSNPKISHKLQSNVDDISDPKVGNDYATASDNGVRFTEIMDGYIHIGEDISDFDVADVTAKSASSSASLNLTVDVFRVDDLVSKSNNASIATGTFSCGALSPDPLIIHHGAVQFFTIDERISDGTNLTYKMHLLSTGGERYMLNGYKRVDSAMALSVSETWRATTTLYTTITRLDGSLVGRGILHISWRNFIDEMKSFGPTTHSTSILKKIASPLKFLAFFAKSTVNYLLSPFRPLQYPDNTTTGYFSKPLPAMITDLVADDGVRADIRVWEPVERTRDLPILFIPGASVDHQVFALPTIPTNTVDYFTGLGYTCYVATLRFGRLPAATKGHTAYDARLDVKAAMQFVREKENGKKFYVVCHCLGSIATGMALLTGAVEKEWIQGMTCSQVFMNPRFGAVNEIKSRTQALEKIYETIAGPWFPTDSTPTSSIAQYILDQLLRFYPIGAAREFCNSTVCHRSSLVFGRLWTHSNLNHATHLHLSNFFGGLHMNFLSHLTRQGSTEPYHLRTNMPEFKDLVAEPGNLERLKRLKIQFVSGGANVVFDPLSTSESYDMLRHAFGTQDYERVVVPTYGHLDTWMGYKSVVDVYPRVRGHIEHCS